MLSSPDRPEKYTVLKIIIKSTYVFNFLKFVYIRNHVDTLVHQMTLSELGKQVWQFIYVLLKFYNHFFKILDWKY